MVSMHQTADSGSPSNDARRIVVVGPCASGKSTLANRLRGLGLDARVCGQEHSAIEHLWKRLEPDILVALDVDLRTIRARRDPFWSASLYRTQLRRLSSAFQAADLSIDSTSESADRAVQTVIDWLDAHPMEQS